MAAKYPTDRLEDVFQNEVVKRFASITDFKRFARSKDGLCLDEHDIRQIEEDNKQSVEDQKLKMLNLWRVANGEMATDWQIRFLVERHYRIETGDQSDILKFGEVFTLFKKQKLSPRGHVYLGEEKFGLDAVRSCAIKFVEFNEETEREGKTFGKLPAHENVISIKRVGVHKSFPFDYLYIAMELGWTRNLRDFFTENKEKNIPFDEVNAKNLTKQLFKGLVYIHENKVIHRDMKPENVLVSDDNTVLKITDFGISKTITTGNETVQTTKDTGTEGYRAQETYEDGKISPASDVYSTGIIFGEIFSDGHHPFGNNPDLRKFNIKNNVNLNLSHVKSSNRAEITELLRKILRHDPSKRPSAKDVFENNALKKVDPRFFNKQKSMPKSPTVSEPPQSTTFQQNTVFDEMMKVQMTEVIQGSSEEIKGFMSSAEMTELTHDFIRTLIFSTGTGEEIIIYNSRSKRFDIHKWINEGLRKTGETKKLDLRGRFNLAVSKEYLYVFEVHQTSRIKYLEPNAEWIKVSPPSTQLMFRNVVFNESIYICGSFMMLALLPIAQKYDEIQDKWIRITSMKTTRFLPCVAATKNHIYCFGGKSKKGNRLRSIDRYDPTTEEWKVLDVVLPRCIRPGSSVTSIGRRIYIHDDTKILCWDTGPDLWTELDISRHKCFESVEENISSINKRIIYVGIREDGFHLISIIPPKDLKYAKRIGEEVAPTLD